jgi:hypothetical protein
MRFVPSALAGAGHPSPFRDQRLTAFGRLPSRTTSYCTRANHHIEINKKVPTLHRLSLGVVERWA